MTNIKGKIVIKGLIKTVSPLHIGCGSDQRSDMDILLDSKGLPFIPATSFIGVLRHTLESNDSDFEKRFWGFAKDENGCQSAIRCSDLICQIKRPKLIRDGIKIDNKIGMAKYQGKYDYEILERGATFFLNMEFTYFHDDEFFVKKTTATIIDLLKKGKICVGAKTSNGLGQIRLNKDETKIFLFDFSKKQDVFKWLTRNFSQDNVIRPESLGDPFETFDHQLHMDITLALKNSLIIRSYPNDPEMPDAVHMKSLDDWILTGSSLKGAIRARAERIMNTIKKSEQESKQLVNQLFGFVDEKKIGKGSAKKGKIRVHEIILPRFVSELQNRIKIDRFAGGTIEGALFDSMPLFCHDSQKVFNLLITVSDCSLQEAGLLLLVLKDIWTGDLAVGGEKNAGRGVFKGKNAFIKWNDEKYMLDDNWSKVPSDQREKLQRFVSALCREN